MNNSLNLTSAYIMQPLSKYYFYHPRKVPSALSRSLVYVLVALVEIVLQAFCIMSSVLI